jgi:hypothetical protein
MKWQWQMATMAELELSVAIVSRRHRYRRIDQFATAAD